MAGVNVNVNINEKQTPPAIVVASSSHHCPEGALNRKLKLKKSKLTLNIIGRRPLTVVVVVINTGRKRDNAVLMTASRVGILCLFINSWNVSINTMLLLTTTPAIDIIPRPPMATQNGLPVIINITNTPPIDSTTALIVRAA